MLKSKLTLPKKRKNHHGFTLIELMIALVVLAFGILGFLFLQGRAVQGRVFGREMSRATFVAQSNIEELSSMNFNHPLLSPGAHPTASEGGTDALGNGTLVQSKSLGNFNYYTNWIIPAPTNPNVKTIQMTVTWRYKSQNSGLLQKSLTLTTVKGK